VEIDHQTQEDERLLKRASRISLAVSIVLLATKFVGYKLTSSQAVFSDAMESIVNVVAAAVAIFVVWYSRQPADQDHPYGHGKAEFFSAAFEGGLIAFASILIAVEAVRALLYGHHVQQLNVGVAITLGTGAANALLGFYLLRMGRRAQSPTIQASGHHVLSDFWTSAGVAVGLGIVALTGLQWLDPVVALVMAAFLAKTGFTLVTQSAGALLDREDREILKNLQRIVGRERPSGIIQLHHVRVMRSGHYHHIDAHAVVPEYWDVAEAHDKTDAFEAELMRDYPYPGELHLHVDPCRRAYCRNCDVADCPIRKHPFEHLRQLSIEELTSPEEPKQFRQGRSRVDEGR
jgi:cation diffusion facilitator family transporter